MIARAMAEMPMFIEIWIRVNSLLGAQYIFLWFQNVFSGIDLFFYRINKFNRFYLRVWSWLRTNAGGAPKTCKSNEKVGNHEYSGARVSNTWITYLQDEDNVPKGTLILDDVTESLEILGLKHCKVACWGVYVPLASWWGKSLSKAEMGSWSERMISHTGTETRSRLLREAAVRNLAQWRKLWRSDAVWAKKAFGL